MTMSRRGPSRLPMTLLLAASLAVGVSACTGTEPTAAPQASRTTDDAAANDSLYRCLMDKGFAVTRGQSGAIEFKDPEDAQADSYVGARADCLRGLEADGTVVAAGPGALRAEYAAMSRLHECLTTRGIGMEPWPTEAVFVEKDGTFNVLSAAEPLTLEQAQALCPDEVTALGGL